MCDSFDGLGLKSSKEQQTTNKGQRSSVQAGRSTRGVRSARTCAVELLLVNQTLQSKFTHTQYTCNVAHHQDKARRKDVYTSMHAHTRWQSTQSTQSRGFHRRNSCVVQLMLTLPSSSQSRKRSITRTALADKISRNCSVTGTSLLRSSLTCDRIDRRARTHHPKRAVHIHMLATTPLTRRFKRALCVPSSQAPLLCAHRQCAVSCTAAQQSIQRTSLIFARAQSVHTRKEQGAAHTRVAHGIHSGYQRETSKVRPAIMNMHAWLACMHAHMRASLTVDSQCGGPDASVCVHARAS